jgi:thioredoxin 1
MVFHIVKDIDDYYSYLMHKQWSNKLIICYFTASWCGPCKMIAPILNEVADEYAGKIKICKVDVDGNPETAAKFNVRGIPTLLVFKNGTVEATKVGALSKAQLVEFVNGLI